jgi:hypothetical protein
MDETKLRAVIDYGERLKTRSENDILFDRIKSHINSIIICIIILFYFRHIILEIKPKKNPETYMIRNRFIPLID